MADWIPVKDSEFRNFVTNLTSVVSGAPAEWGLTPAHVTDLTTALDAWLSAYGTMQSSQAALYAAVINQDLLRKALEALVRADCAIVQGTTSVTDSKRVLAGVPLEKGGTRLHAPVPKTAPVVTKVMIMGAGLVVEFRDQATLDSKAKPAGVREAEIWAKVGAPAPTDGNTCTYLGASSATPYLASFETADAGKPCWLCLRWKNARGEPGPWGPAFATMAPGGAA